MLDTFEKVRLFAQFLGALVGHDYTDGEIFDGLMVARQNGTGEKVRKPRRARRLRMTVPPREEDDPELAGLPNTSPPPPSVPRPFSSPRRGRPKGSKNKPRAVESSDWANETPVGQALDSGESDSL